MNVWNKVLMVLITILCAVFGVLAANRYQYAKDQETAIQNLEADLSRTRGEIEKLRSEIYGGAEKAVDNWRELGVDGQLRYVRNLQNGEAFLNCQPIEARVDETNLSSTIAFGVDPDSKTTAFRSGVVAFVFDSGEPLVQQSLTGDDATAESIDDDAATAGGGIYSFLGAFKVTGATETQVNLVSIGRPSVDELAALRDSARSGNSWVVYADRLPIDSPADLAYFESESPDRAKSLPSETALFVVKTFTSEDVAAIADGEALGANSRYPVDLQGAIEGNWALRDERNIINSRLAFAVKTLTNVVADQLVAIGDEVDDENVLAFEDWDEIYAAAVARKKVASWREDIVATQAKLATMNRHCNLVEKTLLAAERGVQECQDAIDALIADNAMKAAKIAQAQFAALERAEAASRTAAAGVSLDSDI
ncbi:MAG: hypothetical protein ACOX0A_10025 [Thermoguttaceae bacterium]|jgi:hypothetical protein